MLGKRKTNWRPIAKRYLKKAKNYGQYKGPSKTTAPLGRSVKSVHRYYTEGTIDPGAAGATAIQVMSLNGLYDPDITNVGHQPMGFDQMNGLYNDYVVYAASYEVTIASTDTTATNSTIAGVTIYPGATTNSDYTIYCENPHTKFKLIENRSSGNSIAKFAGFIDIGDIYGRTRNQVITEDYFKGNGAANPTDQVYLHVWGAGYGGSNTSPCAVTIRITYYVHWFNAKLAGAS